MKFIFYNFQDSVKAWHLHKNSTLNYVCVKGKVKLVLFDDRENSVQRQISRTHSKNYFMVSIPPNIWNGFKGEIFRSIIANCLDLPHDEKEMVRLKPEDKKFNYKW